MLSWTIEDIADILQIQIANGQLEIIWFIIIRHPAKEKIQTWFEVFPSRKLVDDLVSHILRQ